MNCHICETRRPRRFCPGVRADICAQCCGAEREVTVECPFECEYLADARQHERLPDVNPDDFPNKDVRVTERFLVDNETLLGFASRALMAAAMELPGAIDSDVRESLDTLIRTYRTLESGLYYESRPANLLAAAIHQRMQERLTQFRQQSAQQSGVNTIRDTDVLGVLVFLQRLEIQHHNNRRRGRAFLNFLHTHFAEHGGPLASLEGASGLALP